MRRRVRSALSVRHSVYVLRVMTQGNTVIAIAAIQRCQSVHARARVSVAPVFMDAVPAKLGRVASKPDRRDWERPAYGCERTKTPADQVPA